MRFEIVDTYEQLSQHAADLVLDLIQQKPGAVLGLPTGGTPKGLYAALRRSQVSFAQVQTFNLDEYLGIPREHPESFHTFMRQQLLDHVDMRPGQIHIPDGMAADPEAECLRYEEALRLAGGMDLVILGLGLNGHIGYNEPGAPWGARTRRERLTDETRQANAQAFGGLEQVPTEALTMGIGTILEARHILLLASGSSKAEIVRRAFQGEPSEQVPATALQGHPNVTILLDRAAAALLEPSAHR